MEENERERFAKLLVDLSTAGRMISDSCDAMIRFLGKPYLGPAKTEPGSSSETEFNELPWLERTSQGNPLELVRLRDVPENMKSVASNLKQTILEKTQSSSRNTYAEESWKNYYWVGTQGDVIFRRQKKRPKR